MEKLYCNQNFSAQSKIYYIIYYMHYNRNSLSCMHHALHLWRAGCLTELSSFTIIIFMSIDFQVCWCSWCSFDKKTMEDLFSVCYKMWPNGLKEAAQNRFEIVFGLRSGRSVLLTWSLIINFSTTSVSINHGRCTHWFSRYWAPLAHHQPLPSHAYAKWSVRRGAA